jgi:hypothetical protein
VKILRDRHYLLWFAFSFGFLMCHSTFSFAVWNGIRSSAAYYAKPEPGRAMKVAHADVPPASEWPLVDFAGPARIASMTATNVICDPHLERRGFASGGCGGIVD